MTNQRKLALVGFHERPVANAMLVLGADEFLRGSYEGVILTGTSNPKLEASTGDQVNDELRYMANFMKESRGHIPILGQVPARTLMGNIRNVLLEHPENITFFLDKSQVERAKQTFLPYFQRRGIDSGDTQIISPEVSFREGTAYEGHTSRMDRAYALALKTRATARLTEALCCGNNWFTNTLAALKNRRIQKA